MYNRYITEILLLILYYIEMTGCKAHSRETELAKLSQGIIELKFTLYDSAGMKNLESPTKIWYSDSCVIQEIREIRTHTTNGVRKTVEYPLVKYVYVNLPLKVVSEYLNLSDTAVAISHSTLPDSTLGDGWSFYSYKNPKVNNNPISLTDTVIDNIFYKRIQFHFTYQDSNRFRNIGYLRCDDKGNMFALEKEYSAKANCTMTKLYAYNINAEHPFLSQEVTFLSDTLSGLQLKVLDAWNKKAKDYMNQ